MCGVEVYCYDLCGIGGKVGQCVVVVVGDCYDVVVGGDCQGYYVDFGIFLDLCIDQVFEGEGESFVEQVCVGFGVVVDDGGVNEFGGEFGGEFGWECGGLGYDCGFFLNCVSVQFFMIVVDDGLVMLLCWICVKVGMLLVEMLCRGFICVFLFSGSFG